MTRDPVVYDVLAETVKKRPYQKVCTTTDKTYAEAVLQQFKEAGVKARLDSTTLKPDRKRSKR